MTLPIVPPIADADRSVVYNVAAATTTFAVPFPVFGDGSDLEVFVDGLPPVIAWLFVSASGAPLSTLPLPITDGQIVFATPVAPAIGAATASVQIVGAWHPRNLTVPTAPAITRYDFEVTIATMVAGMRELFDAIETLTPLSPAQRANNALVFDASGNPGVGAVPSAPVSSAMAPIIQAATIAAAAALFGPSLATVIQPILAAVAETLTNKTLTAPIVNGGTINGATIAGGTLSGVTIGGATPAPINNGPVSPAHGRLTLTSGTAVLTATVSAAAIVYYTPHVGNQIPLWDGTAFLLSPFSELSNILANDVTGSAGPAPAVANAIYDLFVWSKAGVPTLTRGGFWSETATVTITNASPGVVTYNAHGLQAGQPVTFSTTGTLPTGLSPGTVYYVSATGLTTNTFQVAATVGGASINTTGSQSGVHTAVAGSFTSRGAGNGRTRVQGVFTNTSAVPNGPAAGAGTHVGTIMTDPGGATVSFVVPTAAAAGGAAGWIGLWNAFNRKPWATLNADSTTSWNYASAAWRAANGSATMRTTYVVGAAEETVNASYFANYTNSSSTSNVGIGVDSVAAFAGSASFGGGTAQRTATSAAYAGIPGLGAHFVAAIESGGAGATFFGATSGVSQTGMVVQGMF